MFKIDFATPFNPYLKNDVPNALFSYGNAHMKKNSHTLAISQNFSKNFSQFLFFFVAMLRENYISVNLEIQKSQIISRRFFQV